jgi:hypothetical protein
VLEPYTLSLTVKIFSGPLEATHLDRQPFQFQHNLVTHPALSLERLSKSIPQMPNILYSKGLTDLGVNFDRAHIDHKNGLSIEETIETIRTSSSYIAIKSPELHDDFRELFADLHGDVSQLIQRNRQGRAPQQASCWLFIASPNAQTPFHFDRYSNFLLQIRGSKEVAVFPNFDERIISAPDCEAYMDREEQRPPWKPELDQYAQKFNFKPGEAIHIPFIAGHYVKNGAEDVSISLSFFFQTHQTLKWASAMQFNHRVRRHLGRFGIRPTPVGRSRVRDAVKAKILPTADKAWSRFIRLAKNKSS